MKKTLNVSTNSFSLQRHQPMEINFPTHYLVTFPLSSRLSSTTRKSQYFKQFSCFQHMQPEAWRERVSLSFPLSQYLESVKTFFRLSYRCSSPLSLVLMGGRAAADSSGMLFAKYVDNEGNYGFFIYTIRPERKNSEGCCGWMRERKERVNGLIILLQAVHMWIDCRIVWCEW